MLKDVFLDIVRLFFIQIEEFGEDKKEKKEAPVISGAKLGKK